MFDQTRFILTKIIATLGPASEDLATIVRLIDEGVRVFRVNFSHGGFEQYEQLLTRVRDAATRTGVPVAVMGDLSGAKIRIGEVRPGGVKLASGSTVTLQSEPPPPEESGPDADGNAVFHITAPQVLSDVELGQRVLIDDGAIRMLVVEKVQNPAPRIVCRVTVGGRVSTAKGVNLPDTKVSMPALTARDHECVEWAIAHGIDFLAQSFVRSAQNVRQLKQILEERADPRQGPIPVVAKIEKPQAIDDLDDILQVADAVMVARGDLGVEMDLALVPVIQKRVIALAHDYGRPVIVATQMLQSMITQASPTRAEVSDVANAIYDGADAVMLSGETAVGQYPIQAAAMMARIARITVDHLVDEALRQTRRPSRYLEESRYRTAALARGVAVVVRDLDAKLVVTWSRSGGGARYLSKNRLLVPIIAASDEPRALRKMNLLYGVVPVYMELPAGREAFAVQIDQMIQDRQWAKLGDPIVLVAGKPLSMTGVSNTLWIRYLGDVCAVDEDEMHGGTKGGCE